MLSNKSVFKMGFVERILQEHYFGFGKYGLK